MASGIQATTPTKIKKLGPCELQILWADGHETRHFAALLRGMCPCAGCQDEMTGVRMVLPMHIPDTLEFRKIGLVGQYAVHFDFSDNHGTGIYSFEYLREFVSLRSLRRGAQMKLIVGISGATGVVYGIRLLDVLKNLGVETHLVITDMAKATIALETTHCMSKVERLASRVYGVRDLAAGISSGSFSTDGMIVAPCSVRTLSAVANCANDNLLTRAADVTLKERRKLVLLFRETPLHAGHCQLMLDATRNGAILMPPMPAFYTKPETVADIVDQTVGRVLDMWGLEMPGLKRWE